ncbi:MAG: hypothetical protein BMS9Abin08_1772 [Gammaproteobacteria bacterium]|nr:MAG: hypothetical protein BMS9Abin08_1772 [Gammaproteobacteria bacterium]
MTTKMKFFTAGLLLISATLSAQAGAADAGERLYSAVPPEVKALSNPYVFEDKVVLKQGKKLYRKNCSTCHGPRGNGKGPIGNSLEPKPTSFLHVSYTSQQPDQNFYWAVREGSPGTAMPAFKEQLKEDEIWKIIAYLRYLPVRYASRVSMK